MTKFDSSENLLQATGKRMVLNPAAFTELINCWVIKGLPQFVSPPTASSELPRFQPMPINFVNCTLVTPLELTELDERELLELRLDELKMTELDALDTGHTAVPTTTP